MDRIADQPPAPPTTATRSATAAHPCRPRPADTAHPTRATAAANHQTTGERSTTAGRPQPAATATATAMRGRSGSGSRRTQRRSRSAHEQTVSETISRIISNGDDSSPIPQMASAGGRKGKETRHAIRGIPRLTPGAFIPTTRSFQWLRPPQQEAPDGSPGTPGRWAFPDLHGPLGGGHARSPPASAGGFYGTRKHP